jgi:hypothetical protein
MHARQLPRLPLWNLLRRPHAFLPMPEMHGMVLAFSCPVSAVRRKSPGLGRAGLAGPAESLKPGDEAGPANVL